MTDHDRILHLEHQVKTLADGFVAVTAENAKVVGKLSADVMALEGKPEAEIQAVRDMADALDA